VFGETSAKARLNQGEVLFGSFINMVSPISTMIAARLGFDVVLLDHEHSFGTLGDAVHCMNAAMGTQAEVWVRIPANDQAYIKRILDCGACGVMCPMVNTAADARQLVRSCHYPPYGVRGVAPAMGRHTAYGTAREPYLSRVADDLAIMPQIETVEAVENIEEIAAVEGIDIVFIGPFDLAASLGRFGQLDHPDVSRAIGKVETAVRKAGRKLATLAAPGRDAPMLIEHGYDLVFAGADVNFLRAAMEAALGDLRAACSRPGAAGRKAATQRGK
jgi:4-hydroxy-2-oxoheptanedioate aldolase